jgi:hypothetical protein
MNRDLERNRASQQEYIDSLAACVPALDRAIHAERAKLKHEFPDKDVDALSTEPGQYQGYLESRYRDKLLTEDPANILKDSWTSWKRKTGRETEADLARIEQGIKQAIACKRARKLGSLLAVKDEWDQVQLLARSTRPDAVINVLRQSFILLMTAFDAAIFDLVRVALKRRFFALASAFGKKGEKLSFQELTSHGSFEAVRDHIIETQLKKCYVKDLLFLLRDPWGVDCVDPAAGDKYERLIEFVLRRNVHVHNRGVVDQRYLDEEKNLDGLAIGEVAVIDQAYWERANRLCKGCVERVAAWADV